MSKNTVQHGFTLVEAVTVILILGIIGGVGTTMLMKYLPNMRLKSASRDIFSALIQAKTEAIKQANSVTLLFNPPSAPYTPADARIPLNSFILFLDNGDGVGGIASNGIIDGGEKILSGATLLPTGVSYDPAVSGTGVNFSNKAAVFNSRGIPVNASTGGLGNGSIGLRTIDSSGNTMRQRTITVSTAGRINMN